MIFSIFSFLLGFAFGWLLQKSNFCVVGAINQSFQKKFELVKMYLIALFVSLLIVQGFLFLFPTKFSLTLVLTTTQYQNPWITSIFSILGGSIFGLGAVFARGCPSRQIIYLTRGKIESLFVLLLMGYAGFLIQKNSLFFLDKIGLDAPTTSEAVQLLSDNIFIPSAFLRILLSFVCFFFLCYFFRSSVFWMGIAIGSVVTAGWIITVVAHNYSEQIKIQSFSFTAPFARIFALQFNKIPDFYILSIVGVFCGCIFYLWKNKLFQKIKLEKKLFTHRLLGGGLMGIGLGCTIGQGIAGVALLSLRSILAFASCCLTVAFFYLIKKKIAANNYKHSTTSS